MENPPPTHNNNTENTLYTHTLSQSSFSIPHTHTLVSDNSFRSSQNKKFYPSTCCLSESNHFPY